MTTPSQYIATVTGVTFTGKKDTDRNHGGWLAYLLHILLWQDVLAPLTPLYLHLHHLTQSLELVLVRQY